MIKLGIATIYAILATSALADETMTFRIIAHGVSVNSQEIGDVDGHVIGMARFAGLATFPDGSIGQTSFVSISDFVKGSGRIMPVYMSVTLDDGSVLWLTDTNDVKVEGPRANVKGTVPVVGGKGRFTGVKGEGTLVGQRQPILPTGTDIYFDIAVNLKK
jgi:hypothetical protein